MRTTAIIPVPAFALIFLAASFTAEAKNLSASYSNSTTDTLPSKDTGVHEVDLHNFVHVESEASFPGGEAEWQAFLGRNLKANIPVKRKAPVGEYTVVVQFIVDTDGRVTDVKALTAHGYGMEEEVVRVIRKSPRWTPALLEGNKKVKAYRKQPINFVVSGK
jgi:TonB family protein